MRDEPRHDRGRRHADGEQTKQDDPKRQFVAPIPLRHAQDSTPNRGFRKSPWACHPRAPKRQRYPFPMSEDTDETRHSHDLMAQELASPSVFFTQAQETALRLEVLTHRLYRELFEREEIRCEKMREPLTLSEMKLLLSATETGRRYA